MRGIMIQNKNLYIKALAILLFKKQGGVLNRHNSMISPKGYELSNSHIAFNIVNTLIGYLAPHKCSSSLKRVGGTLDGSYIILDNLINSKTYLISGGIENNNKFEIFLANKGVLGVQIDNSTNKPPKEHKNLNFINATLGKNDGLGEVSLRTLIRNSPSNKKLIVKMDIEGGEIEAIEGTPISLLMKIDCLVLELHNLSAIMEDTKILQMLAKLHNSGLRPVFVQPNNACLVYSLGGVQVPDNVEVTFIKRRKISTPDIEYIKKVRSLTQPNIKSMALVNIDHILLHNLWK